jgi:PAS domain S-box-containing protein
MDSPAVIGQHSGPTLRRKDFRFRDSLLSLLSMDSVGSSQAPNTGRFLLHIAVVFLAYFTAGKLGQATTNIRSGNLGPVWPASGIALAGLLAYGLRMWPAIAASAFVIASASGVPIVAAAGQALGATCAVVTGAFFLRRISGFDPALCRLRDALWFVVVGAFGSAVLSASIGLFSLYATHQEPYSGLLPAWLIYWLGDSTGVLLVTPLIFTVPRLFEMRTRAEVTEFAALLASMTLACFIVFGDLPLIPIRLHVLSFAVLPFVMWGAINFGIGGVSLSVFLIATMATLATAFGLGPFAGSNPFTNAVLLDVLFTVLSVTGLTLGSVIAEREQAKRDREQLIREQTAAEARLHLAAIVESSNDAIFSKTLDGTVLSWNATAERIFGFTQTDIVGQTTAMLVPPQLRDEDKKLLQRFKGGERIDRFKTTRLTKAGTTVNVSLTFTPISDAAGRLVGIAEIVRDVTQQDRAEQALSGLSRRLIHAQEQERARIARELHDDIGQRLALLVIGFSELSVGAGTVPHENPAASLRKQAVEIATDIQALAHELHSSKLELLGLATAVKSFCTEFASQNRVEISLTARDLPKGLSPDLSLCLFRVLQEALHNAVKHSGARHFDVQLWATDDEVHLVVSDPGRGFDMEGARAGRGLGLVSMDERMKLVNGYVAIETQPQGGTSIHARAPWSRSQEALHK